MKYSPGINSGLDLQINGKAVQPIGDLILRESIFRGSSLHFCVGNQEGEELKPGYRMSLGLYPEGSPELQVELICRKVTQIGRLGSKLYQIEALDPLSIASALPLFSTYSGNKPFGTLVRDVLSPSLGKLFRPELAGSNDPSLSAPWYFQCQETAREFLTRVARLHGHMAYWDGKRVLTLPIGSGKLASRDVSVLHPERDVIAWSRSQSIPTRLKNILWTDPDTCNNQCLSPQPGRTDEFNLESAGVRADTFIRPHVGGLIRNEEMIESGDQLIANTLTTRIRLADQFSIEGSGQEDYTAFEVEHLLHSSGHYSNVTRGVKTKDWATHDTKSFSKMIGPFLARVVENCDPKRQGRIRVSLTDDKDSRPSHWLPVLATSGGSEMGWHWLPEVNDLVLVTANDYSPENLVVLGSVRGADHKIDARWNSNENGIKVLATRNGIAIEIDDVNRSLTLGTKKASIKISGDGEIVIDGDSIAIRSRQNSELKAGANMIIDGEKVLLAP